MKIAVATPQQMGMSRGETHPDGWVLLDTEWLLPNEIRAKVAAMLESEDSGVEHMIVTVNRTVLDMVKLHPHEDEPHIDYEDVYVWDFHGLERLSQMYNEDYLAHFSFGDLFDRGEILPFTPLIGASTNG